MADSLLSRAAEGIDRSIGWSRLPRLLALPGPDRPARPGCARRTSTTPAAGALDKPPFTDPDQADYLGARTIDGTYNDLERPVDGLDREPVRTQRPARAHVARRAARR